MGSFMLENGNICKPTQAVNKLSFHRFHPRVDVTKLEDLFDTFLRDENDGNIIIHGPC